MLTVSTNDHQGFIHEAAVPSTDHAELPSFEHVKDDAGEKSHGIQAVPYRPRKRLAVECGEEFLVPTA